MGAQTEPDALRTQAWQGRNVQADTGLRFALDTLQRTVGFWTRVTTIYGSYKLTQLQAAVGKARGVSSDQLDAKLWQPQHEAAGEELYRLCIDLRGFYLKAGQFIGARSDFVPEAWCRTLCRLYDQVPPMNAKQTRHVIERELGGAPLDAVFEWVDLQQPLGSASISQVHKAKLRSMQPSNVQAPSSSAAPGLSLGEALRGTDAAGQWEALPAVAAARAAVAEKRPGGGVVAVKVQYPDAEATMKQDMGNMRAAAAFLQRTELQFDLVSAVDELSAQLALEFDFRREARVMDSVAKHLMSECKNVVVPRSVPGLVTRRLLVMDFLDGVPITRLGDKTRGLSERTKRLAKQRIMANISEAYGRMLLLDGLFQADAHPGNILVLPGGKVGLLDYGQSKKLSDENRLRFAELVQLLGEGASDTRLSAALWALGVVTDKDDARIRATMSRNMFDTAGEIDVWGPNSTLKQAAITTFPQDLFFVLRVTQLLRGLAHGMGLTDFSSARQWRPWAQQALKNAAAGHRPLEVDLSINV